MSDFTRIWGFDVPVVSLTKQQIDYLQALPKSRPTVEWVWREMDRVWNEMGLNNRIPLSKQPTGVFYSHPVWLMNGIFTATDPVSVSHRGAIAQYVRYLAKQFIADFGGGFGELALTIVNADHRVKVDIVEPYPSPVGLHRIRDEHRIEYTEGFTKKYDVVIAQSVLEHVEDPIGLVATMVDATRIGGYVIFANDFSPVIKCHLPSTFHLRHTFRKVVEGMGLCFLGNCEGAEHTGVFRRVDLYIDLHNAKRRESLSKAIGPFANRIRPILGRMARRVGLR